MKYYDLETTRSSVLELYTNYVINWDYYKSMIIRRNYGEIY